MTPRHAVRATRRIALAALAAATFLPLGGCAVSLFSKAEPSRVDDARVDALERRMDAIERALPPR